MHSQFFVLTAPSILSLPGSLLVSIKSNLAQKCLNGDLTDHVLTKAFLFGTDIPHYTDYEVDQFPLRMRDWLKNIVMQYYESDLDTSGFLTEKQRTKVSNPFQVRPCSYIVRDGLTM